MAGVDLIGLAIALGIGLLIGLQRERAKGAAARPDGEPGVRTYLLLALGGAAR